MCISLPFLNLIYLNLKSRDRIAGDGNAGLMLRAREQKQRGITRLNASRYMSEIVEIVEEVMGGTSGSLYSIFFAGLASAFGSSDSTTLTPEIWGTCLQAALTNLYRCEALVKRNERPQDLHRVVEAALAAAYETKKLVALAGRGSYVNQEDLAKAGIPDSGAWGAWGVWRLLDGVRGYAAKE
ncbi:dihydroxyacetone kinase 1 [Cryptococcus neoformans var. grubii Br795]|uniref:Dihydroxyacetone kinase 1 n=1 Tax=Cryptococcus neoformans Tu259-1 TaxID=1230072 RepID=A0A854QCN3_CRYNE|nr:dihydroxyacetone kinase 1 [Cryptococcus neoformans var. grubii AD1-83a]OXG20610.1 dihydroxyacetone kinase 1 [Cryptococcus neoformans var. grubii Tu259-1]OXG49850.1 dihydroxyacetone kinase 1 [Cryptococcus neoformans var. grubii Th84]OXG59558.1 dihydroxyacetone kinase 1 [Cryptococcus neoformans var. grubii MW-RSA1955]OXG63337.1 dihydroxyacetone kinase 1 [Cryptococcus neoformans var. grubii c8]OXG64377.1 dihydroxyacetone kinase 1 [Cryptococcus neoformans var. grubii CHC193]OXG81276.1 dihydrox